MKLEWTIQYGRLVADRFESMARNVKYVIEPDERGWGAKAIRVRDGMTRIDHTPTRMPLQELVEWCEEDAERPAKCPPQPIEPDMPTAETVAKMSGKASKFPDTMDARDWAARSAKAISGGWGDAVALREWFQAALSHGFREGQASTYEAVDKAQRERDCFGPVSAPEPKPAWQASFDARDWAKEFMRIFDGALCGTFDGRKGRIDEELMVGWFANALMRGYDEHRWKTERESKSPSPPAPGTESTERPATWDAVCNLVKANFDLLWKHVETMPVRMDGLAGPEVRRKVEAIEARTAGLDGPGLKRRLGDLEAAVVNEQGRTMELSVDLKGALDRLAKLEAKP